MDFFRNNVFYVVLVAAVLAVSVPSYVMAAKWRAANREARSRVEGQLKGLKVSVDRLKIVTDKALAEAAVYQQEWQKQLETCREQMRESGRHLEEDFLVEAAAPGETPIPEKYKPAYSQAYDELAKRLTEAKLVSGGRGSVLPPKADFGETRPNPAQIRISQKQYWIVKEVVDVLCDPASGVKGVQKVALDFVPNKAGSSNRPEASRTFWVYPMILEFQMDFRHFPVLLEKLTSNKNVMFFPQDYKITRVLDYSQAVYVPLVGVSLYCEVWDYISTPFEQDNLQAYKPSGG